MKKVITFIWVILMTTSTSDLMGQTLNSKQVIAIHKIELRDTIDSEEFEKFVLTKLAPIYNEIKGQQFTLVKGDRGNRKNKYAVILHFDSIEDRNRIYPEKGESSVEWGGTKEIWQKFSSMAIDPYAESSGTDYIKITH